MITLITMTQGNPIALKRTIDNVTEWFNGLVNEVIVGDLHVIEGDWLKMVDTLLHKSFKFQMVSLPFNDLFLNGFGNTLNKLSDYATNDLCLYMNVGEVIEGNINLNQFNSNYNCFAFNHATDPHRWYRLWNRKELRWSGRIHEEVVGSRRQAPSNIFTMADTEKDNTDPYYSQVMNDVKEIVYFSQYLKLVDEPKQIGATNAGWVKYAKDNYQHIKDRLIKKGARYEAFIEGNLQKYLDNCTEFEPQQNSDLIHFQ